MEMYTLINKLLLINLLNSSKVSWPPDCFSCFQNSFPFYYPVIIARFSLDEALKAIWKLPAETTSGCGLTLSFIIKDYPVVSAEPLLVPFDDIFLPTLWKTSNTTPISLTIFIRLQKLFSTSQHGFVGRRFALTDLTVFRCLSLRSLMEMDIR